jgi:hypothetical protein
MHLSEFMPVVLAPWGGQLPADLKMYASLSDSTITSEISRAHADSSHAGHKIAERFCTRGHMRMAKELILADNYRETKVKGSQRARKFPDVPRFKDLDREVRIKYGSGVMVDTSDHSATKMFETHNLLVSVDGVTRYLEDISEIVGGMSSRIWRGRIYSDRSLRQEVHASCDDWLRDHPMKTIEEAQ